MKTNNFVIYRDIPAIIVQKMRKTWKNRKLGFFKTYGDIPIGNHNSETNKWEEVVNNRGNGYANRNAMRYKKNMKKDSKIPRIERD